MVNNPCGKDCPDRKVGCHGTCEKYLAFWDSCEEIRKRRAENIALNSASAGFRKAMIKKAARVRQGRSK